MTWTTPSGKFKVESLSAETFPGAIKVIRDTFFQDEAVCVATEVNKDPEAVEELLELCADTALDGVSLVAVEAATGKVAPSDSTGKTFFEIFAEERCTRPSSRELMQYMYKVDEMCNFFEKYQTDCSFELMFLGTLREYRGQKLGSLLMKLSVNVAEQLKKGPISKFNSEDLGPKYSHIKAREVTNKIPKVCHAICTTEATRKISQNLGFKSEAKLFMKDYVYNGKTYSERLGDEGSYSEVYSLGLAVKSKM